MILDPSLADPAESSHPSDGRVLLDAALLKRLRKARGLSQEALADLCFQRQLCVSIASIKRAETGKIVLYRTARHLAQVFQVAPDSLTAPAAEEETRPPAAAPLALSHLPQLAPPPVPDDVVRYVILLQVELAAPAAPDSLILREIGTLVQQFGGRLDSIDGSRLSAVFGLPQAFRSDAERAMRCAIELNRHLLTHGGRAMALRLARWEQGGAAPGAADDGLPELRHTGGAARSTDVLPFRLPLYVARALLPLLDGRYSFDSVARHPAYLAFSKTAAGDGNLLPPLIGRYAETRQFKAVAESMLESQCGHIVYMRAMAGVGKSRLAQEFADIARQHGMRCHGAEVQDAGADSWRAPLDQLARSLLGLGPAGAASHAQAIADCVARLGLAAESTLFYHVLAGARLGEEQQALFSAMSHEVREQGLSQALRQLLLRLAMNAPLLVSLEDVHWGDPYLFEALGPLLALSREAPVLWVITSRVDDDPLETALRQQMYDLGLTVFDLAPMTPREADVLANQFGDVDATYRARCVERAQGNPLFLTQLLASPGQHLPDSLKHLIQGRLDSLPPEHAQALRMAAVLGNRFELAVLRAALAQPDYAPQQPGRNSLLRRAGADSYVFVHDLVMHCIYEAIESGQLRRLHLAAADAWRGRDAAQCAQHLYRAGDPGALEVMLGAIRGKLEQHQFEAALDLTAACNSADSTSFSSFPLALLRAHASAGMGNMANARQYYRHAMLLAGRPQDKIDAVIGLAATLNILEELEEEERLLDETVPLALEIGAEAALGKLLHLKGNIYFPRGNYSECRRYHEDAARHAQASAASDTQARALSGVGDSYYAQGRMRKAYELFSQCLTMCERHRYVEIEASNRAALGSTRIYLGDAAGAVRDALDAAQLARRVGNRRAETFARMTAGWALVASGQADAAREQVESGLELARTLGSSRFETFLLESQARVSWLRGDVILAERQILAAVAQVERLKLQNFIGPWVLGTLALFTRDSATRKRALLQGAAYLTRDCLAHNGLRFHLSAAEVSLLDGDNVSAEFYADQLQGYALHEDCAWISHHVELIRLYARWRGAADDATLKRLRQLRVQSEQYGYAQAAPRLYAALLALD
ncbi:MAG: AAA family ATPase [Pseudomonadota bacterium]